MEARLLLERGLDDRRLIMDCIGLAIAALVPDEYRGAYGDLGPDDRILFAARFVDDFIRVEVADSGPGFDPAERHTTRGYGLRLVDKLASNWGVERDRATRVWFEVDRRRGRFERD